MVEQARGLGYVHLERVGTGTFTSAFGTGAVSSSFLRTRDTPARVDCDWRVGPGVRTLRALFSLPVSFFFLYYNTMFIGSSVCGLWFVFPLSLLFFSFLVVSVVFNCDTLRCC